MAQEEAGREARRGQAGGTGLVPTWPLIEGILVLTTTARLPGAGMGLWEMPASQPARGLGPA